MKAKRITGLCALLLLGNPAICCASVVPLICQFFGFFSSGTKLVTLKPDDPVPRFHTGNLEAGRFPVETQYVWENVPYKTGTRLAIEPRTDQFMIGRISPTGEFFEIVLPNGEKRFFRRNLAAKRAIEAHEIAPTEFPLPLHPAREAAEALPGLPRSAKWKQISSDLLERRAINLAKSQSAGSSTVVHSQRDSIEHANLERTNEEMLTHLNSQKPLTISSLESWNENVNRATISGENKYLTGQVRGSQKIRDFPSGKMNVDLSTTEIKVLTSDPNAKSERMSYVPAKEVGARLGQLLAKVNAVNDKTSFADLVQIYQEFILIHPFVEGNGRSARVLLDYCLLKSGLPPFPHAIDESRNVMFLDKDELAAKLYKVYVGAE